MARATNHNASLFQADLSGASLAGARLTGAAMDEARRIFGERADLALCASPAETLQGADCLAIVTEWKIFRVPDFEQLPGCSRTA
mgnify:CR=1 FL=1